MPEPRRFYVGFLSGSKFDSVPGWGWLFTLAPQERVAALRDPAVRDRLAAGLRSAELPAQLRPRVDPGACPVVDPGGAECSLQEAGASQRWRPSGAPQPSTSSLTWRSRVRSRPSSRRNGSVIDDESWRLRGQSARRLAHRHRGRRRRGRISTRRARSATPPHCSPERYASGACSPWRRACASSPTCRLGCSGSREARSGGAGAWYADLVVFNPDSVEPEPESVRALTSPAAPRRWFAGARGISHVLVNGQVICEDGELTGVLPGTVPSLWQGHDYGDGRPQGGPCLAGQCSPGGST